MLLAVEVLDIDQIPKQPGRVAQSVMCLSADLGVASLIPAPSHTFTEIDY